jgi:multidrug efflux pump subunit AcrA (membrane-fusion protein)
VETSARQVATDAAAVTLAERRLSTVIGGGPLALTGALLQDLASGQVKLLRATFALGTLEGATPGSLRAAHLGTSSPGAPQTPGWNLHPVWNAPADASLPGRSFFALLKGSDAAEGERVLVWAPASGSAQRGVLIPAAALVISEGKYWCYVETKPGVYLRREVATDRPVGDGYVVTQGFAAGERLVTAAAGLLLARELNPSTEAD